MDRKKTFIGAHVKKYRKFIPKKIRKKEVLSTLLPRAIFATALAILCWLLILKSLMGIFIGFGIAIAAILLEIAISAVRLDTLIVAIIGGIIGFVVSKALDYVILFIGNPPLSEFIINYSVPIKIALIYLGVFVALRKRSEVELLDKEMVEKRTKVRRGYEPKLLDTSVLIDGRIVDIVNTKFLTGPLILPRFVLLELQELADSQEHIKRARARRGLDMLKQLQEIPHADVKIFDKNYPHIKGVDNKLIQMAKEYNSKIVTVDYGLNKIASVQGVEVLNINELASYMKPPFLPGEVLNIHVVKEGKEKEQGVGYLEDGSLVVVEDGKKVIGKKVQVVVSSVLQTSAGRIIFTQLKA